MVRTIIAVVLAMAGLATAAVSVDGSCGGAKNTTCQGSQFGNCCSQYSYCGSTVDYCGQGCNTAFGTCGVVAAGTMNSTTTKSEPAPTTVVGVKRVPRTVATRRFN